MGAKIMRMLPLSNSDDVAWVSDAAYELCRVFTWRLKMSGGIAYVVTSLHAPGDNRHVIVIRLHRLIMLCFDAAFDVHHIDHNILNCEDDNLEIQDALSHRREHCYGRQ